MAHELGFADVDVMLANMREGALAEWEQFYKWRTRLIEDGKKKAQKQTSLSR